MSVMDLVTFEREEEEEFSLEDSILILMMMIMGGLGEGFVG